MVFRMQRKEEGEAGLSCLFFPAAMDAEVTSAAEMVWGQSDGRGRIKGTETIAERQHLFELLPFIHLPKSRHFLNVLQLLGSSRQKQSELRGTIGFAPAHALHRSPYRDFMGFPNFTLRLLPMIIK